MIYRRFFSLSSSFLPPPISWAPIALSHSGRHKYFHNKGLMIVWPRPGHSSVGFNFLSMTLFILNQSQIENSFPPLSNKVKWTRVCSRMRMVLTLYSVDVGTSELLDPVTPCSVYHHQRSLTGQLRCDSSCCRVTM